MSKLFVEFHNSVVLPIINSILVKKQYLYDIIKVACFILKDSSCIYTISWSGDIKIFINIWILSFLIFNTAPAFFWETFCSIKEEYFFSTISVLIKHFLFPIHRGILVCDVAITSITKTSITKFKSFVISRNLNLIKQSII